MGRNLVTNLYRQLFNVALLYISFISNLSAQTFQDFLDRVNAVPQGQREAIVDSQINAVSKFPLIEQDTVIHIVYRGRGSGVLVRGDINCWNFDVNPMTNIAGTNFWYLTQAAESDARLFYKLFVYGIGEILDPLNPDSLLDGTVPNSQLAMPDYVPPIEIEFNPDIPHGTLQDTIFFSSNLNNSRTITVYTPPAYGSSTERFPVILFQDGLEYVSVALANNVIDYLISQNRIQPIIAVFVPPRNRGSEYVQGQVEGYTNFIVEEVMPWVDSRFRTDTNPAKRAIIGTSNGGNISLWIGFKRSEAFGNIAAQSSRIENYVSNGFRTSPKLDLKIYLDLGKYDICSFIPRVKEFKTILESKGYAYRFLEYNEGHNWRNWRAHVDNALEMFFPATAVNVAGRKWVPQQFRLFQNYPNPFNPLTTIDFTLSKSAAVSLNIYNVKSQIVRRLLKQYLNAGTHSVVWDGKDDSGLPVGSGVYLYQLRVNGNVMDTKKSILIE